MKKVIISIIILLTLSYCTVQHAAQNYTKMSQTAFLEKPFGFEENIKNFSQLYPTFKAQKLLRKNAHYPEKTDTIYRFHYRKSELFFYKTHTGKEFLLAGKILNKQVELVNGIGIGLEKQEFTNRFTDPLEYKSDSLQLTGEGTKYTFIFKKEKLYRINIDNYFD